MTSVRIEGLKGFNEVEIELRPLTVLTGPNNSGKSTVLQAIALFFEVFRRCLDIDHWTLRDTGRAVAEFEFLPVNQPKDLWYRQVWKPTKDKERYVRVGLRFSNGVECFARIRFLFGFLNIGLDDFKPAPTPALVRSIASVTPVLLPATPGPSAHEDHISLAQVHRLINIREPSRVLRNVLLLLQKPTQKRARDFVEGILERYFRVRLADISFDESRNIEIRAPLVEEDYSLDVVSAGSGLNQILQIAAILAWRRPGVVLLDEPDSHLHSSVQTQLLEFLSELVSAFKLQVIVATHSRDLIGQAPLDSIVPVDRTRDKLGPLLSIDHLLLEYQRQGAISNVDLALLYQTKRCLFVEGSTDSRLLPRIADRVKRNPFMGREQVVLFEFGGVEKLKLLPELVALFERLIGGKLRWGALRDSDANTPEVKAKYLDVAAEVGIPVFHQWQRYSIENYLLEPHLLAQACAKKRPSSEIGQAAIEDLLARAVESVEGDVGGVFVTKTQAAYRSLKLSEQPHDHGAAAATRYLMGLKTTQEKLAVYPGKKLFGSLVELLQETYGINLRLEDVIEVLDEGNAPQELKDFLDKIQGI